MLDTVVPPVTSRSAPLALTLFPDTVTRLAVTALAVVSVTILMVSVLASLDSSEPDASTRLPSCKLPFVCLLSEVDDDDILPLLC